MPSALAWAAALPIVQAAATVPVVEANGVLQTPDTDLFIRLGGRAGDAGPSEMGPRPLHTETGALEAHIFARIGTGSMAARQQADRIVSAFRLASPVPGLDWTGWALDEGEAAEDGMWWVLALTLRYSLTTAAVP